MNALAEVLTGALDKELFMPRMARILEVVEVTAREKFFKIELPKPLGHHPGQFVMLSHLGLGEAPISIACGPRQDNILEMVIRKVGGLTQVFHELKPGQKVGVRGPFGSGFNLADFYGKDVLFIVGGLGLAPMRSLIQPVMANLNQFGRVTLISGCRTPGEELFRDEVQAWSQLSQQVTVLRLVDRTDNLPWSGSVGMVTDPIANLEIRPEQTLVALCGPPVMYKFVIMELFARGISAAHVFVDLERRMKCGVGKCGHCQINHVYCCQEGPVFRFDQIQNLREALS